MGLESNDFSYLDADFSLDGQELKEDQNGFLRVPGKIMKAGKLFYGDFTAHISKDELKAAVKSANSVDITDKHPDDMVSPESYRQHTIGTTADNMCIKSFDGVDWIYGDLIIKDRVSIDYVKAQKAKNEKVNISAGYYRKKYSMDSKNAVFKDIVFNHVAIGVGVPRATGASLDSKEELNNKTKLDVNMKYKKTLQKQSDFSLDEMEIEYDESHEKLVSSYDERERKALDSARKQMDGMKKSMDEATGAKEAMEEKVKMLEEKLKGSISKDELTELNKVKAKAQKYGVSSDSIEVEEIMGKTLEKVYNKSFDSALIRGAFSTLPDEGDEYITKKAESNEALQNAGKQGKSNDSQDSLPPSRQPIDNIIKLVREG